MDSGDAPVPEIMIPLVATRRELELLKDVVDRVAKEVFTATGTTLEYLVGTMIELPRAALMAGEIAEVGEFFSFGTNDLTQTTLGCLLYTSPSPRDRQKSRMPSSA